MLVVRFGRPTGAYNELDSGDCALMYGYPHRKRQRIKVRVMLIASATDV